MSGSRRVYALAVLCAALLGLFGIAESSARAPAPAERAAPYQFLRANF